MGQILCPAQPSKIIAEPQNKIVIPINSSSVYNTKLGYLMSTEITSSRSQAHQSDHGFILKADKEGKLFTKYFLIYNFYISKYNFKQDQYQQIYTQYMNDVFLTTMPEQKRTQFAGLLDQLQAQNKKGNQRNQLKKSLVVLNNVFKSDIVLKSINQICLNTTNPIQILHVIFPIAELNNGINKIYHDKKKKQYSKIKEIYVVTELQTSEVEQLKQMKGNACCFSFSVFVKAFTNQKAAKERRYNSILKGKKNDDKKLCFFVIILPKNTQKMQTRFDQGFYYNQQINNTQQNVLINIRNSFSVVENPEKHQFQLQYAYVPTLYHKKYVQRAPNIDPSSIQIFQICNAISTHYLKSQSWLMRILKQCENSTALSKTIINKSSIDATRLKQAYHQSEVEVVNLINDFIDRCQYDEALLLANKYPTIYIIQAKKIEILFKAERIQETEKELKLIGKDNLKAKSETISQGQEIVQFIHAKILFKQNSIERAKKKLRNLRQAMQTKYSLDFQIIGRDLIKFIDEVDGKKEIDPKVDLSYSHSKVIKQLKDINLRGISTSI